SLSNNSNGDVTLDSTNFYAVGAEPGLHAGPFGRFYVGPTLAVLMLVPDKRRLDSTRGYQVAEIHTTITGDVGMLFGSEEQIEVGIRLGFDAAAHPTIGTSFAYHFLLGAGP